MECNDTIAACDQPGSTGRLDLFRGRLECHAESTRPQWDNSRSRLAGSSQPTARQLAGASRHTGGQLDRPTCPPAGLLWGAKRSSPNATRQATPAGRETSLKGADYAKRLLTLYPKLPSVAAGLRDFVCLRQQFVRLLYLLRSRTKVRRSPSPLSLSLFITPEPRGLPYQHFKIIIGFQLNQYQPSRMSVEC